MFDTAYQQNLQDQIGQLGKLLGVQGGSNLPASQAANQFDCVSGLDGAKAYQQKMLSGTKHIVWDNEQPVFYVLQKDANGTAQRVQICNFTVELEPTMEDKYVTRDDFNALLSKLDGLLNKEADNG